MTEDDVLALWTIYERPADYPDGYVARKWIIGPGGSQRPGAARYRPTLAEAREAVPPGMYRLDRDPHDDPTVVETWI